MNKNLEQAYENFTEEYNSKTNTVPWFLAQFKTHLSKNITLEDWNNLQQNLKNIISDDESIKKLLDNMFDYLTNVNSYTDEELDNLLNETVKLMLKNSTAISSGDDLNASKYMQVGVYYGDNRNETLINCPTKHQFRMEVYDMVGDNSRNPDTQTWVYRVRIVTDITGRQWMQGPHSANSVGVFLNTDWHSYGGDSIVSLGRYTDDDFIEGIKHFAQGVEKVHMSKYPHVEGANSTLHTVCYTAAIKYVTVYTFYSGDQFSFLKIFTNNPAHSEYTVHLQWNDSTSQYDAIVVDDMPYSKTEIDNKIWQVNDDMANNYMELESMIEESRNEIEDRANLVSIIGNATETLAGIMSSEDKKNLNTLVALLQDDENNIVDTINEVLAIFNQYPEGANLVSALSGKADKSNTYSKAETDNLLADKVNKNTYEIHLARTEDIEKQLINKANKADTYTKTEVDEKVANAGGGINSEDVMNIIEENSEQTTTLEVEEATEIAIGTSATFNPESDEQVPTSKAVAEVVASAGGGSKLYRHDITIRDNTTSSNGVITLSITNSDETPFTKTTLIQYLYNNGYNDSYSKSYPANGGRKSTDQYLHTVGLYASSSTDNYIRVTNSYLKYATETINETQYLLISNIGTSSGALSQNPTLYDTVTEL